MNKEPSRVPRLSPEHSACCWPKIERFSTHIHISDTLVISAIIVKKKAIKPADICLRLKKIRNYRSYNQ